MATVYELKKFKKKKHRLLKVVASVVILAIISLIAAILITNNGRLSVDGFLRLFSGTAKKEEATEYSFSSDKDTVFAVIDGGLAVCSGSSMQVFDTSANKVYGENYEMRNPTICTGGTVTAVYDLEGTSLKVFDTYGVMRNLTTEGKIISAALNKNNWLVVCTQESGGYKGLVTVYDAKGDKQYDWYSAEGYVLSAAISPDNKSMAALTLTDEGSRIVFYSLNSTDEKGSCTISGDLVLEIKYMNDGSVLAIRDEAILSVKPDGSADVLTDYTGKYLSGYSLDGNGFSVLVLNDYAVGDQGHIMSVDQGGKELGNAETAGKVLSVSAKGNYLAVLYSGILVIYDKNMKECARFDTAAGSEQTIMRSDGSAFVFTGHSAALCSIPAE